MALIKCNECGQMISDKAVKCPKCGSPQGQDRQPASSQEPTSSYNTAPYKVSTYENEPSEHKLIYAIIGVLAAALVGLGLWAWQSGLFGNSQNHPEQIVDSKGVTNVEKGTSFSDNDIIDNQSMDLKGKIGKYPITMHLDFENNNVNGYYSYDSGSSALQLSGTINDGHVELNETTQEGRPTGHFEGELDGDKFSGEFINYNGEHFKFQVSDSD